MDATLASYHARLATFEGAATTGKGRRTSSRSKKAGTKSKASWPLAAPSAQDLAYAGFVWRPTSASPDNVQCFSCECQLDGWEEADVPAYEHATHSPSCGFATIACIRLRAGDPGRTEEDPTSDAMVAARRSTFDSLWPLDVAAGYPSVDQMVAAGWFYDPATDTPDGVTCPYCSLALDAWDIGDDPMQEHRRRSPDCLFFVLSELYKPAPAPKKGKRASKAKRTSTRSSNASTVSKKATRGKKRTSDAVDQTEYSEVIQPAPKRVRSSSIESFPSDLPVGTPKKTPTGIRDNGAEDFDMSSLPADLAVGTPKRTPPMMSEADDVQESHGWKPADIDALFASQEEAHGFMNDILIDAGLDNIQAGEISPERLYESVMAGLTDQEKRMTVEQWVLYNAKRGEEKLRMACEQQILAFEAEGRRAMAVLEAIPTV
ncbi:inhibitor of apoptosis repeat-containing protein [Stemphylium lycopersici]|uniref:Inhibitor of apoptosis repeat-containing protein n=1 Tax=Stemphylium lycopersici TaxID=183478 RepID=A0A364NGW5_STELY|nr:chromosome segregation protein [Stemphylium lycopersici]RAR09745.1 inhibitor of apoptosis repeat-containing protein [Stemphylium lycopersici]RAR16538.1 inhibitor of apoptosis repeat-containing protein [Stemphylium lycopersici]